MQEGVSSVTSERTRPGQASGAAEHAPQGRAQRARILAAATELIAAHGVRGMTMRQLAAACDLNIATLYHYFSSKSDLVGAIVDERQYDSGLRELSLPVDPALPARARLEAFFVHLATQSLGELRLWRLLVGESLRDDAVALAEARRLSVVLEQAVDRWLGELFPELDDGSPGHPGNAGNLGNPDDPRNAGNPRSLGNIHSAGASGDAGRPGSGDASGRACRPGSGDTLGGAGSTDSTGDTAASARGAVTTVVSGQLLAVFLQEMLLGEDDRDGRIARSAAATAAVVFPAPP